MDVRPFWTDPDTSDPPIIAKAAAHPPVTFPYKISSNDPEVFWGPSSKIIELWIMMG
ncbi:hypothetical protein ABZ915_46685 [Streptomyces sp. NPDC046915]|uniref:hypothetical protein n=1 Tax=Streptomyces sp. NPDC046915 TaxID=3155257 RepID=UPI0033FFC831